MGFLACVNIPRLPLQLFGRRAPELKAQPMAVISEEKPLGIVLEANRSALNEGVHPGMRYAAALSIAPALEAAAISQETLIDTVMLIADLLLAFSPSVEPASIGAGTFWLNADGLDRLFGNHSRWAKAICTSLAEPYGPGFTATVAVGTTRFGTYAAARMFRRNIVFAHPEQETELSRTAPLRILPFDPLTADTLSRLGVHTVREFLALPEGGVRRRFGLEAAAIHRFVAGRELLPVQAVQNAAPLARVRRFASPAVSKNSLRSAAMQLFAELYEAIVDRRQLVRQLDLTFIIEPGWNGMRPDPVEAALRPASPTQDRTLLEKLITLRIDTIEIGAPVEQITLSATMQHAHHVQRDLFVPKPQRDPAAADRALALIRAEIGNDAVCTAHIVPEHLPARRYSWEPIEHLASDGEALPVGEELRKPITLVRRIFVSAGEASEEISRIRSSATSAPPTANRISLFSGAWWDEPYEMEYRYLRGRDGTILWLAYDRLANRWLIQGSVE